MKTAYAEVPLDRFLLLFAKRIAPEAKHKHLIVRTVVDAGLRVRANRRRLEGELQSLFSKAARRTPSGGGVEVCGRRDGREAVVDVTDGGPGMTFRVTLPLLS